MSGEAIALLLLLGASVGLASGIAAAGAPLSALAAPYIDTSVLAVLFVLFASVSAWHLMVTRFLASQGATPPNSIIKSPSVICSAAFWPLYWASARVWLGHRTMVQGGGHE